MKASRRPASGSKRRAAEIMAAAARVFAQRGYHGTSTQDIADVLGIRQASLYYYFPSKEVALEQVCLRGVEGFLERAAAIAAGPGSAADKVASLIHGHLAPTIERPDFVRVFLRERRYLPDASRRRVGRVARRYERIIEDVLARGVARREFARDLDCRMATLAILAMCNAASGWLGIEPRASIDRVASSFAHLVTRGALARSGAARRRFMTP